MVRAPDGTGEGIEVDTAVGEAVTPGDGARDERIVVGEAVGESVNWGAENGYDS